jgi:hypothetical protein
MTSAKKEKNANILKKMEQLWEKHKRKLDQITTVVREES